jgi:3-phenylpropionate/cinnamic acid dioxygenase small subunit
MSDSRREIENLLYRYAEAIDRGDFARVAQILGHAAVSGPDGNAGPIGPDFIRQMYEKTTRLYDDDGTPHTRHVTTNAIIEVDEDAGTATSRSYFTVFQALPELPLQPIVAGRYHDAFERVDGAWRFSARKMMPEHFGDMSHHLMIELPGQNDAG